MVLMLSAFVMVFSMSNNSIQAQEVPTEFVEVKDQVLRDFLSLALTDYVNDDFGDYYMQKYHAKELKFEYPSSGHRQMWLQRTKASTTKNRYTHVLKVRYNKVGIVVNGVKKEVATDTYTYNINPYELLPHKDMRGRTVINPNAVKLISFDHKEQK